MTLSPVLTAASARVVGTPRAAIASLTMYSRITGAEGGLAISSAGERRASRTFELDIAAPAIRTEDFAQQQGASVTKLRHELTKLMASVGFGNRLRAFGNYIAGKHRETQRLQPAGVDAERFRQGNVNANQLRIGNGRGTLPGEETFRQAGVSVVKVNFHLKLKARYRALQKTIPGITALDQRPPDALLMNAATRSWSCLRHSSRTYTMCPDSYQSYSMFFTSEAGIGKCLSSYSAAKNGVARS